ncbi:hybrid sensor histidine kinase/response regulator [Ferrimonas senticii]|uniref:PAS domain-containing hybrid sensor histidine kinase/response regulator n=1 Tax=Ferrimonas senticii TaxID=394566 RepID=UPI000421021B|nr:hybrid sensor histidine kinase/response regulator [Ferrimonas senticii]
MIPYNKDQFFQHSHCAMLVCVNDAYSTIAEANQAFYDLVGYSREEMQTLHQNRFASLVVDDLPQMLEKVGSTVRDGTTLDYEFRIRSKSGELLWIHDIATYDKESNLFTVVIMDITYRQNTLEAISKTASIDCLASMLSSLIDNIPSPIAIYNGHKQRIVINQFFKSLEQRCLYDPTIPHAEREAFFAIAHVNISEQSLNEPRQLTIGGQTFQVRKQVQQSVSDSYIILIFEDITALKEKQQQLTKAIAARDQFLAVISHELRTPIAAMIGLMELLDSHVDSAAGQVLLENAKLSADRLKLHVNDILDFSKIEAGQLQIDATHGNLLLECSPIFRGFEKVAHDKGLQLRVNWQPSAYAYMTLDWLRLHQIINNVLSNALKFTDSGMVYTNIQVTQQQLHIKVTDTGCGMTAKQMSNLFKPFVQGDKSISRKYGGTGLGLSIVKNLLDILGGCIAVDSKHGVGTAVTITLPISAEPVVLPTTTRFYSNCPQLQAWLSAWQISGDPISASELYRDRESANLYPDSVYQQVVSFNSDTHKPKAPLKSSVDYRVLCVDDNEINRLIFKAQFDSLGIAASLASSAAEALQLLLRADTNGKPFDVLVTDLHMPEMNGFELTEAIRQQPRLQSLPVICCTADNAKRVQLQGKQHGMSEIVFKPYTVAHLQQAILRQLKPADC